VRLFYPFFTGFILSAATMVSAQEGEDIFGLDYDIGIATGSQISIYKAPAIASVITSQNIQAMGARDLDEVLNTVPGLHVSRFPAGYKPLYLMRGIDGNNNAQVLVLVDGMPQTNLFLGDRGDVWGGMPVEDIAKIEIIRGPGSALYGADAYAGVINIITKTFKTADAESSAGARQGSFNTTDAWLTLPAKMGDWESFFSFQYRNTDGHKEIVSVDSQTTNDFFFGTSASLAPGPVSTQNESVDARLNMSLEDWVFRFAFQSREIGNGAGVAQSLDPIGTSMSERMHADAEYRQILGEWEMNYELNYLDMQTETELLVFPPGVDFTPVGGGLFPDGVIGQPDVSERHIRFRIVGYRDGTTHDIRGGIGVNNGEMYDVREQKNFSLNPIGAPVPLGQIVDVSATAPFISEEDRQVTFGFVQDEWKVSNDWSLTTGVRVDDYSDFGNTVNPRVALVHEAAYDTTLKFLYARAFRAPSFSELYAINNPIVLGNPDLDPETIETFEMGIAYFPNEYQLAFNIFYFEAEDIISFVTDPVIVTARVPQNVGKQSGQGVEFDFIKDFNHKVKLNFNLSFQQLEDELTGNDKGRAPGWKAFASIDWSLSDPWQLYLDINHIADRSRDTGDLRGDPEDYTLLNANLRYRTGNHWAFELQARNLLDEEAVEPSPYDPLSPFPAPIANDLPLAERSAFFEINYDF
jgi:outer membrane receptor for ferrienterochelin and colicin